VPAKPDYGIDAPGVIRNLFVIGAVLIPLGLFVPSVRIGPVKIIYGVAAIWTGGAMIVESLLMLLYAKWGKFRHRDRMLRLVSWRGDETVLDVGTGRGLLIIAAAKRLKNGRAVGIDIWKKSDLSGNSLERTLQNIAAEGVAGKVELLSEDAQKMSFPDATFDVVLSNLCLHNIPQLPDASRPAARSRGCSDQAAQR